MKILTKISFFIFSTLILSAGFLVLSGASGRAQAVAKTPAKALQSTGSTPPNWPWQGVVVYGPEGGDFTYPGSTPAALQKMYDNLAAPGEFNSIHIELRPEEYFHGGCQSQTEPSPPYPPNPPTPQNCTADSVWNYTMAWLDEMLAKCNALGITAVLDLESVEKPGGAGYYSYYNTYTPHFWDAPPGGTSPGVQQIYFTAQKLAQHIVNWKMTTGHPALSYAYDIISEPTEKTAAGSIQPPGWPKIQEQIVQKVRAVDPSTPWMVVKPGPWGGLTGYQNFDPLPESRLVYSVHVYVPGPYTNQYWQEVGAPWPGTVTGPFHSIHYDENKVWNTDLSNVRNFILQNSSPLDPIYMYVGEFSAKIFACDSNHWLHDMVDIWQNQAVPPWGWAYQEQGGWPGWSPDYTYDVQPPPETTSHYPLSFTPIPPASTSTARWKDLIAMFTGAPYPATEGACLTNSP